MANTAAREQSYLKALMFLGPQPRAPKPMDQVHDEVLLPREEMTAYQARLRYDEQVQDYWVEYVFDPDVSVGVGTQGDWINGFYHWQRLHACKGE